MKITRRTTRRGVTFVAGTLRVPSQRFPLGRASGWYGRTRPIRRGVTLIEMLVTVAVLVLIMTIMVQIFQAATGAVTTAQALQGIDDQLKLLDSTIRLDLAGVTARFTPPLNPALNLGYFEYGENEFADNQGEDSDDYIRFTAKAPPGRPFTGRVWLAPWPAPTATVTPVFGAGGNNFANFPLTLTSEYAEIIYFLRNGNLYRRVLLIAPELQTAIVQAANNTAFVNTNPATPTTLAGGTTFNPMAFNQLQVSWQAVNDLSASPAAIGPNSNASTVSQIHLNSLGDLTNRENRFAYSRFANDFWDAGVNGGAAKPDGIADDVNNDNVPDFYPTMYYNSATGTLNGGFMSNGGLLNPPPTNTNYTNAVYATAAPSLMAFPFKFPGAYSKPQALQSDMAGWIHSPTPMIQVSAQNTQVTFDTNAVLYLNNLNHNPLETGPVSQGLSTIPGLDNLPVPLNANGYTQTWWGFPTWRETLSAAWNDPTRQVNDDVNFPGFGQPTGLHPLTSAEVAGGSVLPDGAGANQRPLLPAMANFPPAGAASGPILWRTNPQLFSDLMGDTGQNGANSFYTYLAPPQNNPQNPPQSLWGTLSWEDDLIMTGVRSFDIKAYDNVASAYVDLGWGDDQRITSSIAPLLFAQGLPYLYGNTNAILNPNGAAAGVAVYPCSGVVNGGYVPDMIGTTFAHEGRIPPLVNDNRLDANYPNPLYASSAPAYTALNAPVPLTQGFVSQYGTVNNVNYSNYSSNIGDNSTGIDRLRRVWDSWSTEYSQAPGNGVYYNPNNPPNANAVPPTIGDPFNGFQWGPNGGVPPIVPSYPPPYPAPLRGIQIQIRVVDPSNQRIKSVTIRQDFTDKL
jgi:prepilin-type N-terminal cleavage/methylation domain-containing protein